MLVKDLISTLQELQTKHEGHRYLNGEDMLGEADIYIDVFAENTMSPYAECRYAYKGASREIKIEVSNDGVLNILSAFSASYPKEGTCLELSLH